MTKALQLELQGAAGNFSFDVEGALSLRLVPVYRENVEPPELVEIREAWEVSGCRIRSSTGAVAELWTELAAFLARVETRGAAFPTYARIVRDPAGANVAVRTLGPPDYEQFKVDEVEGLPDHDAPEASFVALATVTVRVSAARRLADGTPGGVLNGVVGFTQEVRSEYRNGLRTLEWRTRVTTREGTDATAKAKALGKIPIGTLGGDYSYETNGPGGVDLVYPDANEATTPARKPTVAEVVSRVRQWGISTGVTAAGSSPDAFELTVVTNTSKDEETTTTVASADGPGALAWVTSKAPVVWETKEIEDRQAANGARGTWTRKQRRSDAAERAISVDVTPGREVVTFRPVANGQDPVKLVGARLPWRAVVSVVVERRGGSGKLEELPLPAKLPEPWAIDWAASVEGEPAIVENSPQASQRRWRREARYVYLSASRPELPLAPKLDLGHEKTLLGAT